MNLKVAAIALLLSSYAYAVDQPQWIGPVKIETVSVQSHGNIYVKVGVPTPDLGCSGNADGWLQLETSAQNFESKYSLILAASLAKKEVKFHIKDCGWYPYINSTDVAM